MRQKLGQVPPHSGGMQVGSCVLPVGMEQQWVDELN